MSGFGFENLNKKQKNVDFGDFQNPDYNLLVALIKNKQASPLHQDIK
jgi:hypothetical protein